MRRRLDLAVSLVGRPDVLFLDEPTTGLDPRRRNEVWDEVRGLAADGTTVLLTTQYLEEAEQLADDLVVQGLGALVMLPLTFGSNVFVPSSTLPGWLQGFVEINPVSKVADAARGLLTGGAVAAPATTALIASGVLVAVFGPVAVALYRRRT